MPICERAGCQSATGDRLSVVLNISRTRSLMQNEELGVVNPVLTVSKYKSVTYSGMVFGIGIDVVENERISDSIRRHGQRFVDRVFHSSEIDYCRSMKNPAPHFAVRFAAKEAVSKAFGTGFSEQVSWRDIEISRKPSGEPFVILHGGAAALADRLRINSILVSLSHTEHYAVANALLMTDESRPGDSNQ